MSVEREAVREQRDGGRGGRSHHLDQAAHPLLAAGAERRDDAVVAEAGGERVVRHLQLAGVDAEAGQRAARAQARSAFSKVSCVPSASMATSAPPPVRRLISATTSTFAVVEHDVGAHPPRHREPVVVAVDADDQRGAHQLRAGRGAQADRALREDHDRVADA